LNRFEQQCLDVFFKRRNFKFQNEFQFKLHLKYEGKEIFFCILNKYSLILNCFGQKEPDCLIKTKQTDAHKIDFNCL